MELDLKDAMAVLRKRLWLIAAITLLVTVATGIANQYVMQPEYTATIKLIVNKANEQPAAAQPDINAINSNIRLIDTYKEIIKTPAIMDAVAAEYPQLGMTSRQLIDNVKAGSVNNTQVMTLQVSAASFSTAADIVNAVSKVFQREIPKIMKVDNVSILNEVNPLENAAPVKPNKAFNTAVAFVASLMAAIGLAFLLEFLDDTIKQEREVDRLLGLPTLSTITKMRAGDLALPRSKSNVKVGGNQHATIQR